MCSVQVIGATTRCARPIENLGASRFAIDTLQLIAAAGAAVLGKWAEVCC